MINNNNNNYCNMNTDDNNNFFDFITIPIVGGLVTYFANKWMEITNINNNDLDDDLNKNKVVDIYKYDFKELDEKVKQNENNISIKNKMRLYEDFTFNNIKLIRPEDCFIVHIDGKNFTKIFRDFNYEYYKSTKADYSPEFTLTMEYVSQDLMFEYHPTTIYVATDEIILYFSYSKFKHLYSGNINKILSNICSSASISFNHHFKNNTSHMKYNCIKDILNFVKTNFEGKVIVFNNNIVAGEYMFNRVMNCYTTFNMLNNNNYNYKNDTRNNTTPYFLDTIRFGTFIKREYFYVVNLRGNKINRRRRIIRFNLNIKDIAINSISEDTLMYFLTSRYLCNDIDNNTQKDNITFLNEEFHLQNRMINTKMSIEFFTHPSYFDQNFNPETQIIYENKKEEDEDKQEDK